MHAKPTSARPHDLARPVLPALRLVKTPTTARRFARALAIFFVILPFALLFIPWQQTITGSGRVTAFRPDLRLQPIEAPIEGRVVKIHKSEGERVKKDEIVAEMKDVDPDFMARLKAERNATEARENAAKAQVAAEDQRIADLTASMAAAIAVASAQIDVAKQTLEAAKDTRDAAIAEASFAKEDFEIHNNLVAKGLEPERMKLRTEATLKAANAQVERTKATVKGAEESLRAATQNLEVVKRTQEAAIQAAKVSRETAVANVQAAIREEQTYDARLSRQSFQVVRAPADGVIYRISANSVDGAQLVRPGEVIAQIVPDVIDPTEDGFPVEGPDGDVDPNTLGLVVELFLDNRDAPLVRKGADVRLQFEGWPAVQFMGYPSAAVGTFGGRVILVDPTCDDKGRFRVLVRPHRQREMDRPWPTEYYLEEHGQTALMPLRQGNRTNGWVFLNRVPLWWELWRQLNGFPPVIADEPGKEKGVSPLYKRKAK